MCDYSMHAVMNRKAVVGDKVITSNFQGRSSHGLESLKPEEVGTAICLIPGTGIEFDKPVQYTNMMGKMVVDSPYRTGRYISMGNVIRSNYNDAIQFPDGTVTLLVYLKLNQTGTVAYVPEEVVKQTDEPKKTVRRRVADLLDF